MSAFWNRARHVTSSCRCTLCNPSRATTVPRRVNLNTAPAPRQQGVSDAVTLFYGTVMAAALYTDASIKIGRKNRLEENITEAKDEAKVLEKSNRERLEALGLGSKGLLSLECEKSSPAQQHTGESNDESRSAPRLSTNKLHYLQNKLKRLEQDVARAESSAVKAKYYSTICKIESAIKFQRARLAGGEEWLSMKQNSRRFQQEQKKLKEIKERKRNLRSQDNAKAITQQAESLKSQLRLHLLSPLMAGVSDPSTQRYPPGRSAKELWQDRTRQPATPYYSKRQEMAVSMLIFQLLDYAMHIDGSTKIQEDLGKSDTLSSIHFGKSFSELAEESCTKLKFIYRMKYSSDEKIANLPTNPLVQFGMHQEDSLRSQLLQKDNNRLAEVFLDRDSDISLLVRVCDVLASFDRPLDIHAFNVLLINFNRLQHTSAAEMVWDSIAHCGLTCNEVSVAAILKTYSALGSSKKFDQLHRDIDALDGVGVYPLNESTNELASSYPQLVTGHGWRGKKHMNVFGEFEAESHVYVRVPRNKDIYDALIAHFLRHDDFEKAGEELHRMLRAGIRPSVDIVNSYLIQALGAKDRDLGRTFGQWIFEGAVKGERSSLRETIYLLAQLSSLSSAAKDVGETDDFLEKVNEFALKQGLISSALKQSDFKHLTARELKTVKSRSLHICRLKQPLLHLRFEEDNTKDLTGEVIDKAEPQLGGRQPINLLEYTAANLLHVHECFVQQNGPIGERDETTKEMLTSINSASKWIGYKEGAIEFLSNRPKKRTGNAKARYLQLAQAKKDENWQVLTTVNHGGENFREARDYRPEKHSETASPAEIPRTLSIKSIRSVNPSIDGEPERIGRQLGAQRWVVESVQQGSVEV